MTALKLMLGVIIAGGGAGAPTNRALENLPGASTPKTLTVTVSSFKSENRCVNL